LDRRISLAAACAVVFAAPLAGAAQNGTENYYFPPKIGTFGKTSVPIAGPGKVVVKVLVKANGTFDVTGVLSSTNHGDDAAALDIAKHSTYHPAGRGVNKTPVTAYYDFTVAFTGSGVASDGSTDAGGLAGPEALMHEGKYADAAAAFTAYVQGHPGDQKALVDLALTDVFQSDYAGATAAFDKVTTIPDTDKAAAVKAYSEAETAALKAGQNADAVADAKKVIAIQPGPYAYNALGSAEHAAGDDAAAAIDFQKARDTAGALKTSERVLIDLNLLSVLYASGKDDAAKAVSAEIVSLDPTNVGLQNVTANHYVKLASAADAAGNFTTGESEWEQAALAAPPQAAIFYGHAAIDELNKKSGSDLMRAKSYADKGLAVDPNNALANYAAGYVLAKQGKKADALTYLNRADAAAKTGTDSGLTSGIESLIKQVNGS
jgi:tetratricopeptide (TPR) repeat protein